RGPKPQPPWSHGRGDPTRIGVVMGGRALSAAPMVKEFKVRDGDKTVTIAALPGSTQEQVEQAYRRQKEMEARKAPLEKALEAGDSATVASLVAAGAMRRAPKPEMGESWVRRVVDSWRAKAANAGGDMKRQAEVSHGHVTMLTAFLDGPGS